MDREATAPDPFLAEKADKGDAGDLLDEEAGVEGVERRRDTVDAARTDGVQGRDLSEVPAVMMEPRPNGVSTGEGAVQAIQQCG